MRGVKIGSKQIGGTKNNDLSSFAAGTDSRKDKMNTDDKPPALNEMKWTKHTHPPNASLITHEVINNFDLFNSQKLL